MSKTAKNKKLNDAYLAKRREQKKMSMRKAREKLKNNPEKHEEIKLKRRQNYKKLKEEGKIKSIEDFSAREQRKIRKEWKIRSKNYRRRQKRQEVEQEFVSNNTPPLSPQAMEVQNVQLPTTSRQKDSGKKLARRNRDKKNKEIKKLKEKLKKTESKLLRYKSKLFRLKNKNLDQKKVDDSPRKVVDELVQGKSVSKEIKKKLLFGEVLAKQLKENFKKTKIRKRTFISCVTGDVVQRYRMEGKVRLLTSRISVCTNYLEKRRINHRTKILSLKIKEFLERDDNSRNTAGKKETITRKKLKKQKRFLNDTLKNLHTKFVKENPEYTHLSYSTFCIHRPFWVTIPTAAARDTCLCKKHANFGLLVSKLKRLNLINEKTPRDVLAQLCCPGELKEKCLQRDCENCSTKSIQFNHFNGAEESSFEKWVTKKVPVMIKGKIKLCQKTIKITEHCELSRLVGELKKLIVPFMKHVCNIIHQFKVIQDVKENLTEFEALFHFDYSQNYSCKYGSEIQSFHFGGSRSQITLQTSVVYFKDQSQKSLQHKSFCTISENLRHDPSAVCAHLDPVICTMKGMIPNLKKVHLLSDGPATQYKNKKMFHLFGNYLSKKLDVDEVVWHYSEAGHGKGAADGIGGSTKRLADSLVGRGFDIANFEQFKNALEANCKATTIFSITTDQIEIIDRILPQQIETFPGTMQVHQVTWDREKPRVIQARRLSCMKCSSNKTCLHYHLGEIIVETAQSKVSASNSKKLHYSDVYSSDESGTDEKIIQTNPKVNNYVLVKFEGKNQIYHYIGIVMKTFQDEFLIKFMKKSGSKFVWPEKEDVSSVELKDIVAVLDEPNINNRQQDKKKSIDPKDFTLEDVVNSEIWKMPGSLNGQQFVIQNCKNSTIYVLDHTNMITLDDCIGCKIILGPVKGSVFIRDCKECVCVVACGQFRLRDCRKLDIFLSCATQPIMESSSNIHFGCYQLHYTGIEDHFKAASLSLYNNSWSNIHDFTPSHGGDTNWCILPNTMSITDYLNPPYNYGNVKISLMKEDSVVPFTAGIHAQPSEESETCLVVFFFDGREEMMALNFIRKFNEHRPDAVLLTTKQISMEPRDAEIVFGTSTYNRVAVNGPLIGLICSGKQVIYSCQKIVDEIAQGSDRAYVSDNPRTAVVQAETFASIATMHLAS